MTTRTAGRLARAVWVLTVALLAIDFTLGVVNGTLGEDPFFVVVGIAMAVGYSTVGALVASRHPGNPIGWLFSTVGLGLVLGIFAEEYLTYGLITSPGSLPGIGAVAWVGNVTWIPVFATIPLVLLLFPDGEVPSPGWRPLLWIFLSALGVLLVAVIVRPGEITSPEGLPGSLENPTGIERLATVAEIVVTGAGVVVLLSSVVCAAGLVVRFRRASGEVRQQIKWLAYVVGAAVVLFVAAFVFAWVFGEESWVFSVAFSPFALCVGFGIPAASGIAILKYRLFDLDIVVRKTLVFGVLAVFITVVYAALVIGVGTAVGSRGSDFLSFLAAATVAIAFQPVRSRARRLADRLVYGKRATPYEVLSEFAERVAGTYSMDDVLPRMAQLLALGTGAARAEVWLRVGGTLRLAAAWPEGNGESRQELRLAGDELPDFGPGHAVPVRHQGELLGALTIALRPGDPLTPSHEKLVADLAAQAGLVLRNVRLIEELRASRQRLVAAQDEERRRLERNLHDGAQQQLVALSMKLRLAEAMVVKDPDKGREMLSALQAEAGDAIENLRELARGIYPPLLADRGLSEALASQARKAAVPVEVKAQGIGRYSQEVEAAVYFCCLEALQNVAKYAEASRVVIRLADTTGTLRFTVEDDGKGFDPAAASRGAGLQNMADRLAAIGGSVEIRSSPGAGTAVTGTVPARAIGATS